MLFLLSAILLIININFFSSPLVGVFLVFFYLIEAGFILGDILYKWLNIRERLISFCLGVFSIFSIVAFISGIFITLYQFNNFILSFIIIIVSALFGTVYYKMVNHGFWSAKERWNLKAFLNAIKLDSKSHKTPFIIGLTLISFLFVATLWSAGDANSYFVSPWKALPSGFTWVAFFLSAAVLFILFKASKRIGLLFIILFSLLLHLYIPATYRIPYGLDDWRHAGMIKQIDETGVIQPYVIKPYTEMSDIGPFRIPSAFVGVKLTYSSFWGAALFLYKTTHVSIIALSVWWQYLFFSLFLPILLFAIAKNLELRDFFRGKTIEPQLIERFPLIAAYLPAIFYPFQLYGAISLPAGYNFLFFLFFLFTILKYLKTPSKSLKVLIAGETALMFFGYVIYFIAALLTLGFLAVYKKTEEFHKSVSKKMARVGYLFISIWLIPLISLFASPNAKFEILATGMDYFAEFARENFLYLFGITAGGGVRPQKGNLVFHEMKEQFVNVFPFNLSYFDTILFVLIVILVIWVLKKLFAILDDKKVVSSNTSTATFFSLILYLFCISVISIFLDQYYFGGIHLLVERMDLLVDATFVFIVGFAILLLMGHFKFAELRELSRSLRDKTPRRYLKHWKHGARYMILVSIISLVFVSTYISGPVFGRAVMGDFKTMQAVYNDIQKREETRNCVLSEQFSLAALEAVSSRRVINGNFPIKYGYLEENGDIFIKMFSNPKREWMEEALNLAGARACYFVLSPRFMAPWSVGAMQKIFGAPLFIVDGIYVWRYDGEKK